MDALKLEVRLAVLEEKVDRLLNSMHELDVRQRHMEQQLAKMGVLVGFVSAAISAGIAAIVGMIRK